MKLIKIIPITSNGKQAVDKHLEESKKIKLREKMVFRASGYTQTVENGNILLTISNRWAGNPIFIDLIMNEIDTAMKENGAVKAVDYIIEVN
jgi:hypothetical protein